MSSKMTFETPNLNFDQDDNGAALFGYVPPVGEPEDKMDGLFLRVHSWDETRKHLESKELAGKRVRITVEVIEEGSDDVITPPKRKEPKGLKGATVRIHADEIINGIAFRRCPNPNCGKLKPLKEFGLRRMAKSGENGLDLITNQSWCQDCR